jgi:YidC/Oxa1 family membrane protein insertase
MAFNFDPSGKNHPSDLRNMLVFIVAAILLWLAYDHFILGPRTEAARQASEISAIKAAMPVPAEEKIRPRQETLAEGQRITIDAPEITGSFSTTGVRFDDIVLKNYYTDLNNKDRVVLMSPAGTEHPHYAEIGWLADDASVKVPDRTTVWQVKSAGDLSKAQPAVLTWSNGQGLTFERSISVDSHYMISVTQTVINTGAKPVTLYPYSMIARRGFPPSEKGPGFEGPLGYIADDMHEISYKDVEKKRDISFSSPTGWIGFGEKYWLSALLPDQSSMHTFRFSASPGADAARTLYQVDVRGDAVTVGAGATVQSASHLFAGAKRVNILEDYENKLGIEHFDLAVDFGMLYFMTRPLYFLLNLFNGWVGNFGIAILMLTLAVRTLVFPLTNASYKSFAKLRKVSPKMAELKIKYGSDKPRMQQELIKLYETEKVNPLAGCFPLILQIPIFFAVYKVISISIEMRHAPFFGWIQDLSARDPLSVFNLFGLLPYEVPSLMIIGPWSIAMLALMIVQKHMNPPPQDQIQKDMANYMPWVMTYVLSSFPSGLVIYWTFSNLISVTQQYIIMRMMGVPVYLFSPEKALAYAESQNQQITAAAKRAKEEVDQTKAKKEEPVKESLFDDEKKSS